MRRNRLSIVSIAMLAVLSLIVFALVTPAVAQREKVLYSFNNNGRDGYGPYGAVIFNRAGNLYGTTVDGGTHNVGTVFELTPAAGGGWTERVLHSFGDNPEDGAYPIAGLVFDAFGNLYGTTYEGGTDHFGSVFELISQVGGGWSEKTLHSFSDKGADGEFPASTLIFDARGNLYGTTQASASTVSCPYGCGTIFELMPQAGGVWTEKTLHIFSNTDGNNPNGLIFDAAGNLYGTTFNGGALTNGAVFELSPGAGGKWTETVLYSFPGFHGDGYFPGSALTLDSAGNLYGTTQYGGAHKAGTVFELIQGSAGTWTETVLHSFGTSGDGVYPTGGSLLLDAAGNIYGTTYDIGGTVYELTPTVGGSWSETVLHQFAKPTDGSYPVGGLTFDARSNLYGTTDYGGTYTRGTVYEIVR